MVVQRDKKDLKCVVETLQLETRIISSSNLKAAWLGTYRYLPCDESCTLSFIPKIRTDLELKNTKEGDAMLGCKFICFGECRVYIARFGGSIPSNRTTAWGNPFKPCPCMSAWLYIF